MRFRLVTSLKAIQSNRVVPHAPAFGGTASVPRYELRAANGELFYVCCDAAQHQRAPRKKLGSAPHKDTDDCPANPFRLHALCPMLLMLPLGARGVDKHRQSVILEECDFETKCQWEAREF